MRGEPQSLPLGDHGGASRPAHRRAGGADRQLAFAWDAAAPPSMPLPHHAASAQASSQASLHASAPLVVSREEIAQDEETIRLDIERTLARALGVKIALEITRNRRTMISTKRAADTLRVRLHRMFLEADGSMIDVLGRYVRTGDRRSSRRLGDFIEKNRDRFVAPRPRATLRTDGHVHDLLEIFASIEHAWFSGGLDGVAITWGKQGAAGGARRRRKRSIRLGTYTHDERLIRVHPVLDQAWVPRFFLEYIVFHEMLHHVEPAREDDGRTIFHTAEFRAREQAYPDYERALRWERANIDRLLAG